MPSRSSMSTSPDSVARTGVPGPHLVCDLIAAPRITIPGVRDRLDSGMRAIIARQGMMFVATSDGSGVCDCTFRAGPPGFVRVLDEGKLVWPEYRGNGVLASAGNITENPHVGLLFPGFIEGRPDLYVNGLADLTDTRRCAPSTRSCPRTRYPAVARTCGSPCSSTRRTSPPPPVRRA